MAIHRYMWYRLVWTFRLVLLLALIDTGLTITEESPCYMVCELSGLDVSDQRQGEVDCHYDKKMHRSKTLTSRHMQKLASLSDSSSEMTYFRNQLLKPILRVRVPDTPGHLAVQEHIRNTMRALAWAVEDDPFTDSTPLGTKQFNNIIATLNPSAPRKLVIACHYDSKYFRNMEFLAATDSAVPCAMMLDLARVMNDTLWKEDRKRVQDLTLQFLFFDGEEAFVSWSATDSTYGARHLATKMENSPISVEREIVLPEIDCIDVFLLLDLIGHRDVQFRNWFSATEQLFSRLQKIEQKMGKASLLEPSGYHNGINNKYFIGDLMSWSAGIEDDHIPFHRKGVPVLHLISYPFPAVWHKETDNESALDFTTINNLSKIIRVFVAEYLHLSP